MSSLFIIPAIILSTYSAFSTPLMSRINVIRESHTTNYLVADTRLMVGAQKRACDLAQTQQWSHDGWIEAVRKAGYPYPLIGENLARNFTSESDMINAWMKSPTHRRNILTPQFNHYGIGRCDNYVVMWFGDTE